MPATVAIPDRSLQHPVGGASCGMGSLPAGFLAQNLAALFATDLSLARTVDALDDLSLPPLVPTRSGHSTAAAGGTSLASTRHPVDEAKRLVDTLDLREKQVVAILGIGLGYHVAELLSRVSKDVMVLAFEPNLGVLRRALECVNLSKPLRSRQLTVITSADKAALFNAIGNRTLLMSMGLATLTHAPSMKAAGGASGGFFDLCTDNLRDFSAYARTSVNTVVLNGRKTAENITRNTFWYAKANTLAPLKDVHKNRLGIVISAGPSLRKNQHLLAEAKARGAILIAVQTMLKPLLAMGIEPHYVTSLDFHEISGRFFEDLPRTLTTTLVAEPKCTPKVLDAHPGPVVLTGSPYAESLLRELSFARPTLPAGATVAHLCFYLAQYLGCSPIAFVGQDLGFSDNLIYAPGTRYDDVWRPELSRFCSLEMKQWDQIIRERPILRKIPAAAGGQMYTEERLFTYLQQFERDFTDAAAKGQIVLDCTEGGALKQAATPLTLREALERYCPVDPVHGPAVAEDDSRVSAFEARQDDAAAIAPSIRAALLARKDESLKIAAITHETLPLLQEIADHLQDQPRVNKAIAKIDRLRARMNDLGPTYDLITDLTQKSELQRFQADLALANATTSEGKQKLQIARDLTNVTSILQAATDFAAMIDATLAALPMPLAQKEAA